MSNALTLARPYARAAFALAQEHGRLVQWSRLLDFAATLAVHPQMHAVLGNPALRGDDALTLLLPDGDVDPNFRQFVTLLASNHRLVLLPDIAVQFEALRAEAERVVRVKVTSAEPLSQDALDALGVALRRRFGGDVAFTQAVDPELIGGAVIDAGDVVIDGSVRGKLARLQQAIAV